jgi:amino acid adenylation domain-containing protein
MKLRGIEDLYELSPMQQGILFHSLAASELDAYLIKIGYTLQGKLDLEALDRAWQRVVDRNPILRTSFHWESVQKPLQAVHREVRLSLERHDWRGLSEAEQQERLSAHLAADRGQRFELNRLPLMRVTLIRTAEDRHRLFWTFHHILLEGWSASLVLDEVFTFYRAFSRGLDIDVKPRRPYRDYILWLQRQDRSKAELYWRQALRGLSAPTTLDVGRPPGDSKSAGQRYEKQQLRLSVSTSRALQVLAQRNQLTLNTVLQGAWAILLGRYSGQEDVLFGSVVSGRQVDLPGSESMVGLFVNTLPLRVRARPEDRLLAWLRELQAQQVEMREYEYSALIDVQAWSEVPRGMRLFESLFTFENWFGDVSVRGGDADLQILDVGFFEGGTDYPLAIEAGPGPPLSAVFSYDRRWFEAAAITRMLGHYESLLKGMAAHPDARLLDLPLLGEAERGQLVVGWNETAAEYSSDFCVHELFERQVEQRPDAVAVTFGDQRLSYGEMNRRANQLGRYLRRLGVGPEVVVGLCMERSAEMVVALLGILKAGGAYLPLDPAYPAEQLTFMVSDARMPVLLTQERLVGKMPEGGTRVVCVDRDWATVAEEGEEDLESGVVPENLAYVIYTSGSTGRPKGVEVRHGGLLNLVRWHQRVYEVGAGDRATQLAGPAFDASVWELWPYLTAGASIHIPDEETRLSPSLLRRWLASEGITLSFLPTPLAEAVLKEWGLEEMCLRALLTGGDKLHRVMGEPLPFRLVNHYGPTEGTVVATCGEVLAGGESDPPIGRPIDNTRTYVLDRELSPVPVGVGGELYIGGDGLARGYLGRPELTAERFVPDPFSEEGGGRLYRTGDLVRYLADGNLEFLGRMDNQVKVRGFRIELGEIEAALGKHPLVREAIVLAREDQPGEKRLVAYVCVGNGEAPTVGELRDHVKGKLPEHMLPSAFVVLESLPLSPNGKVDRRALPAPDGRSLSEEVYVAPRTEAEEKVAAVWRDVLRLEKVGIHDNFFDLGGHSLLLVQVHGRLRESFPDSELSVVALFEHPTIASLAAHLWGSAEERAGRASGAGRTAEPSLEGIREGRQRLRRRREIAQGLEPVEGADA